MFEFNNKYQNIKTTVGVFILKMYLELALGTLQINFLVLQTLWICKNGILLFISSFTIFATSTYLTFAIKIRDTQVSKDMSQNVWTFHFYTPQLYSRFFHRWINSRKLYSLKLQKTPLPKNLKNENIKKLASLLLLLKKGEIMYG